MSVLPPSSFDEHFLTWLQTTSEAQWKRALQKYSRKDDSQRTRKVLFSQGLRWLHGLTEDELLQIEQQWSLRFPPDYRLFLSCLHAVDLPPLLPTKDGGGFQQTIPPFIIG